MRPRPWSHGRGLQCELGYLVFKSAVSIDGNCLSRLVEFDIQVAAFNNWHRLDWDVLLFHISGSIFTEAPAIASRRRWGSLERP